MDLFIDYPDGNVNVPSEQQIEKDTPEAVKAKLHEWLVSYKPDPNFRITGISNADPLCLISGHGGAWPGVFGPIAPIKAYPTKPGPQPWNAGITPGYQQPQRDDAEPVSRAEHRVVRDDLLEMVAAVAKLMAAKGVR